MKKLLAFILVLSILALAGCSDTGDMLSDNTSDLSSQIETNISEIISSSEDISSEEPSSEYITNSQVDESTTTSSTESTPSSKVEETTPPTSSESDTESKTETPTTPTQPTTFFEKHNLKLSPLTTNVCFSAEENHICALEKQIKIDILTPDYLPSNFPSSNIDSSKYKRIKFEFYRGYQSDCKIESYLYIFDKYTGTILNCGYWKEINSNNATYVVSAWGDGAGGGWCTYSAFGPTDYDGFIFAMVEPKERNYDILNSADFHSIDEVIDFKNDEYYLFAAN